MAIGTGAAILGSSLVGGLSSIFGAKGANDAAARNAAAAAANTTAANQAIHEAMPVAWDRYGRARDDQVAGLRAGQNAWWNQMAPIAGQTGPALNAIAGQNTAYQGNTQFTRDPNLGGYYDDLRSQNFLQSPDYQFRKNEAIDAVQGSAVGNLYSGATMKAINDRASNMAAGEYGNWFNRQTGLADRDASIDAANYQRASNQFADNYARDANQFANNYAREDARNRYLAGVGLAATEQGANLDRGTELGIGNANAANWAAQGSDVMNAGQQYSNNLMNNASMQVGTPYTSPWGGINQAVQGGIGNYLWAQNAGLMGGGASPASTFNTGAPWQQQYGAGNYGHVFNPLFGGSGNKPSGVQTFGYPGGYGSNNLIKGGVLPQLPGSVG